MTQTPVRQYPTWFGPLMVLIGGCCVGLAPIAMRLGLDALGPQVIAFWRYAFALPLLLCLVLLIEKRLPARPNKAVMMAGVFFGIYIGLWHWALTLTTVSNATFIVGLGNLGAGLAAWVFLKDKLTPTWGMAAVIALLGAAALSLGSGAEGKSDLRGDLLAVAAAILISLYVITSKVARRDLVGIETIFWLTFFELLVAIPLVIGFGEAWLPADLSGFAAPLFLAVFAQIIGQGLIIFGIGHTSAGTAGILVLAQPVVAAIVSWQLFEESLLPLQIAGAALILVGIYVSQRGPAEAKTAPTKANINR